MNNLESRIGDLEKTALATKALVLILEFVDPGRGTVALRNLRTRQTIDRLDGEGEAQFLARARVARFKLGDQP